MDKDLIRDTNGAGDSFVGGFLSQIALGKDIDAAIRAGKMCSRIVLQQIGCTFPDEKEVPLPDPENI